MKTFTKQLYMFLFLILASSHALATNYLIVTAGDVVPDTAARIIFNKANYTVLPHKGADGNVAITELSKFGKQSLLQRDMLPIGFLSDDILLSADLVRAISIIKVSMVVAVKADSPLNSFADFKKAKPSLMVFGTQKGKAYQIALSLNVPDILIIPSTGGMFQQILGGHVTGGLMGESVTATMGVGKVKAIYTTDAYFTLTIVVPESAIDSVQYTQMKAYVENELRDPEIQKRLKAVGLTPNYKDLR